MEVLENILKILECHVRSEENSFPKSMKLENSLSEKFSLVNNTPRIQSLVI
jgi:hypothetical protein